jgi:hypothetical protein
LHRKLESNVYNDIDIYRSLLNDIVAWCDLLQVAPSCLFYILTISIGTAICTYRSTM